MILNKSVDQTPLILPHIFILHDTEESPGGQVAVLVMSVPDLTNRLIILLLSINISLTVQPLNISKCNPSTMRIPWLRAVMVSVMACFYV